MSVLRFWLDHVTADGGLWEPAGGGALVVLTHDLADRYRLPDELLVTDDPDVARSDGLTFLGAGHPVLAQAAESVLSVGDAGVAVFEAGRPAPSPEGLQAEAREQIPVAHGRVDLVAAPRPETHWLLRVGALVTFVLSEDDHVCEHVERWVHVDTCREVPGEVVRRLASAPVTDRAAVGPPDTTSALAQADGLIEAAAQRRRAELAADVADAHVRERRRAEAYYADVVAGLLRRLEAAPEDRRALLAQRLAATEEEQARRLAEIAEKHAPRHEVRPYRLHALGVPALRMQVDVRRGERRYPLQLDWLVPVGVFAQPRCPSCSAVAPLVAGKSGLGCLRCQVTKPAPVRRPVAAGVAATSRSAATGPAAAPAGAAPVVAPRAAPPLAPRAAAPDLPPPARRRQTAAPQEPRAASVAPVRAERMTDAIWKALAGSDGRAVSCALAEGGPAAALAALYGPASLALAVAIRPGERLLSVSSASRPITGGCAVTDGTVFTSAGARPFALLWQPGAGGARLAEALPCDIHTDLRFGFMYWWRSVEAADLTAEFPLTSKAEPVCRLFLRVGVPWLGLPVAARAMAAWARLSPLHPELAAAFPVPALAAAVHRLVALRAGDKGHFRPAADAYGAREPDVRAADVRLRQLLALGPTRAW